MRKFYERDEDTGMVLECASPLFPPQVEDRAEQIMKALDGLKVCSAQHLLNLCQEAVLQYPLRDD